MKVIARIQGGLGNQLFCYAAARRLALADNAELVLDHVSGFARDKYRREYALSCFELPVRIATAAERLEPFERYRRAALKLVSRTRPFAERAYIEQEGFEFDPRLLALKLARTVYLDGLWQSETYFKDVEAVIRSDLRFVGPADDTNRRCAAVLRDCNSIAVHVRWFEKPGEVTNCNVSAEYYAQAAQFVEARVRDARYCVFSDNVGAARAMLRLPEERTTYISHNSSDPSGASDLWLLSQCKHFINANSTFSWWGAWLSTSPNKLVVCPSRQIGPGNITAWNFAGQIPNEWVLI